jgi:membrane protein
MRNPRLQRLRKQVDSILGRTKAHSRGVTAVFARAVRGFGQAGAAEAAAAIAYYTMFSLFPLLLAAVAFWSTVLENPPARERVLDLVARLLPVSREIITDNLQRLRELRGAAGVLGLIGFVWSATSVFSNLARAINRAWPGAESRGFLRTRLVALAIAGILAGLLIISLVGATVLHFLRRYHVLLWEDPAVSQTLLGEALSHAVPWLLTFLMLLGLYQWVPNTRVRISEAFWGALPTAVATHVTTAGFTWYLSSGLAGFQFVYGPLGAVVALMVWIYLNSLIVLFGAHLSAAIGHRGRSGDPLPPDRDDAPQDVPGQPREA